MRAISLLLLVLGLTACRPGSPTGEVADTPPTRADVWTAIQPMARRYRIDAAFIYALVAAESNFDPLARNGDARGLLQIKPRAWRNVATRPYEPYVWNWRANLAVGVDYLAFSRATLHKRNVFSYPLLLAAFHYGLDYVKERRFDVSRVPVPDSRIYQELWRGNLTPVPGPR